MNASKSTDPADDPFPLILDAHILGQITDDERDALLQACYPDLYEGDSEAPAYTPRRRNLIEGVNRVASHGIAAELEAFANQATGDTVSVSAIRSFAARLRRR